MVHEKLSSMFLRSDRIIVDLLQYLCIVHIDLVTTRRATVGPHHAPDHQSGFLAESLQRFPELSGNCVLQHDTLNDTGAVAQLREKNLAARTHVVKPSFK